MKRFLVCFILLIIPFGVWAQESDTTSLSDHDHIEHMETVIIKDKSMSKDAIAQTLNAVLIKREQMLLSQGNTFMNTLEKLPGISTINTGVGIAKPVIRGMSLNRVIVTEYGVKQEGQQWGLDHGLEIDQFNVDRVEVIKGPMSVIYGSEGIGGVINILPPSIPSKDTVQGELISSYKSNNDLLGLSGKLLKSTERYYIMARASYQNYGSYRVPAEEFIYNSYKLPIYNNRLKNTGGNEFNVSLLTGIKRNWGNTSLYISNYRQQAGFFVGAFGIPRAYQLADEGNYRKVGLPYQLINHTKIVSNTSYIKGNSKIEADLGFQYNMRTEFSQPHVHTNGIAPQGNKALDLQLMTLSGHVKYAYLGNKKWRNTTGISTQFQHNKQGGFEFLIPEYKAFQLGLYHFTEWTLNEQLLVNAGLRMDYAQQKAHATSVYKYNDAGNKIDSTLRSVAVDRNYFNVSGSIGTAWQWHPFWKLKFNLGSAFRIPTITELTANGVHHGTFRHEMGDVNLDPEQGWMTDLGVDFSKEKLNFYITPFFNYFSNYIYLRPSGRFSPLPEAGQIYTYQGAPTLFVGAEARVSWNFWKHLSSATSMEYVYNKNVDADMPLPFTPPLSILEEINWHPNWQNRFFSNTTFAISGQLFATQNRVDRNEPETAGYFLVNVSGATTFNIGKQKLTLFAQVHNLTNAVYMNNMSRYRILNLPEQGINAQVMLRWSF